MKKGNWEFKRLHTVIERISRERRRGEGAKREQLRSGHFDFKVRVKINLLNPGSFPFISGYNQSRLFSDTC